MMGMNGKVYINRRCRLEIFLLESRKKSWMLEKVVNNTGRATSWLCISKCIHSYDNIYGREIYIIGNWKWKHQNKKFLRLHLRAFALSRSVFNSTSARIHKHELVLQRFVSICKLIRFLSFRQQTAASTRASISKRLWPVYWGCTLQSNAKNACKFVPTKWYIVSEATRAKSIAIIWSTLDDVMEALTTI